MNKPTRIDCLQYCNWSRARFEEMRAGGLDAVHVTICYHENFRETVANITHWNDWFAHHRDLIFHGRCADDVRAAQESGRTAIFFGFQNCAPIEDDIRLVEICHSLGACFMQLTYNNQSLLAGGCYEPHDSGITRMGRQVISEMNRLGMVIDMSHSGERSTLEAIELSSRPIAVTHANPSFWRLAARSKSDTILLELAKSGGMLGLSLYPHHLKDGSQCTLKSFCEMVARTAEIMGADNIGIGSDLCRGQPDLVVAWMRTGRWSKDMDVSGGVFPPQPPWFESAADFGNLDDGLRQVGFNQQEVDNVLGENWQRFFVRSFVAANNV
ncbi:dipeptidase [Candidatus Persebacteraceae bacterium Df01]|uniref:Dipeptidase n=1 Tax=Candidatus Doriopsillibacter californiensis TaxID=2970740 RepID=A0ABT7QMI1_9GAMM|nr:dipeptidase [Candidatus Persebacteraceae bacterium Df01]